MSLRPLWGKDDLHNDGHVWRCSACLSKTLGLALFPAISRIVKEHTDRAVL